MIGPHNLPVSPPRIETELWEPAPSRLDRLETALSRHWITSFGWVLLLGLGIAAPIVGFAILHGGM